MTTAAIYARYSSDKQSESSLADQERNCRRRADSLGASVAAVYSDAAISGSRADRPQYQQMLHDGKQGRFEVLLVDDLSRLSRDSIESERAIRHLEFEGIRVIGVCDGYDSEMSGRKLTRGMRALVNEVYLDDLRDKTHRGLTGKALKGLSAGGKAYGYVTRPTEDGFRYEIEPEQADTVRWIFERYAAGWSSKRIAAELNERGIPSPRGGTWAASAIYGHPKKGTGIIRNQMYIGTYVWNRSKWVKDPETGKRVRRERPRDEWLTNSDESLRIVPDSLWTAAQARMRQVQKDTEEGRRAKRREHLLTGILVCGQCGGPLAMVNQRSYGCSWHRYRGSAVCDMRLLVRRDVAEQVLLEGIKDSLRSPILLREFKAEVGRLLKTDRCEEKAERLQDRLRAVEGKIRHYVDAIGNMGMSPSLRQALQEAETEKNRLQAELRIVPSAPKPVSLHVLDNVFKELVDNLETSLANDVPEARQILRSFLVDGKIPVRPRGNMLIAKVKAQVPGIAENLGLVSLNGSGGRI